MAGRLAGETLVELVGLLVDRKGLDRIKVMEVFDDQLLGECKMIDVDQFKRKKMRLMTKNV